MFQGSLEGLSKEHQGPPSCCASACCPGSFIVSPPRAVSFLIRGVRSDFSKHSHWEPSRLQGACSATQTLIPSGSDYVALGFSESQTFSHELCPGLCTQISGNIYCVELAVCTGERYSWNSDQEPSPDSIWNLMMVQNSPAQGVWIQHENSLTEVDQYPLSHGGEQQCLFHRGIRRFQGEILCHWYCACCVANTLFLLPFLSFFLILRQGLTR